MGCRYDLVDFLLRHLGPHQDAGVGELNVLVSEAKLLWALPLPAMTNQGTPRLTESEHPVLLAIHKLLQGLDRTHSRPRRPEGGAAA